MGKKARLSKVYKTWEEKDSMLLPDSCCWTVSKRMLGELYHTKLNFRISWSEQFDSLWFDEYDVK
jgi:hypothetical protein